MYIHQFDQNKVYRNNKKYREHLKKILTRHDLRTNRSFTNKETEETIDYWIELHSVPDSCELFRNGEDWFILINTTPIQILFDVDEYNEFTGIKGLSEGILNCTPNQIEALKKFLSKIRKDLSTFLLSKCRYVASGDSGTLTKKDYESLLDKAHVQIYLTDVEYDEVKRQLKYLTDAPNVYTGINIGELAYNSPKSSRIAPTKQGFVYLMRDAVNGYIKIGYSQNPKYRERTLQSEKPTIELITAWCGDTKDEKELHNTFAHKRLRGEWFSLDDVDIDIISDKFKQRNQLKV